MNRSNLRSLAGVLVVSTAFVGGALVACGGDGDSTVSDDSDSGVDGGQSNATDSGVSSKADGSVGSDAAGDGGALTDSGNVTDAGPTDAGQDAARAVNPDGGCDPVQNGEIYVDPNNGSDDTVTPGGYIGQTYSAGCALRTIGKALTYAGATPAAGTKIIVIGPSTVQTGETFPITVPSNVAIVGSGGKVTVTPGASDAFILSAPTSGIANLTLAGAGTAAYGARFDTGSTATTALTDVDITGFTTAGIYVENTGIANILAGAKGVHVNANGIGLLVVNSGKASLVAAAGSGGIAFNANTGAGIDLRNAAALTVDGVPGPVDGTGSVIANANGTEGVLVEGATGASVVSGLVVFGNTADGINLYDTSTFTLRKSQVFKNGANGVHVSKASGALAATAPANIDLGKAKDGKNVLQVAAGNANGAAGLCFDNGPLVKVQTLSAQGNTFSGVDCSANAMSVSDNKSSCTGGVDVGLGGSSNAVDITMCTLK